MPPISPPYREELVDQWSAFLDGRVDRASIARFVGKRLADYGPEELIHSGVQLLNDDLIASREGVMPSHARFDAWQREVAEFDEDPAKWNRDWARAYAERLLPDLKPASRAQFLDGMREKLTVADVEELAQRFDVP